MAPQQGETLFEIPMLGLDTKSKIICTTPQPKIYLLTFTNPPDNRLITPFCHALHLSLDILQHRHPPGVVITTSSIPKFYSNGMDISHSQFTRAYMPDTLYALWKRVLTYPMPTVAMVNGHAFAGGLMLAMMHDYRVMNPHKGFLCLNELELGMPLRAGMMAVFRMKLNGGVLRRLVLEAHRYRALDALRDGVVDHLGGLEETVAFVEEMGLVKKAGPGASGGSVYGELKREMWRETVEMLERENWGVEHVREAEIRERVKKEKAEEVKRVEEWERMNGREKAKL